LLGFCGKEHGSSSDGTHVVWPPVWLSCLPKLYFAGHAIVYEILSFEKVIVGRLWILPVGLLDLCGIADLSSL